MLLETFDVPLNKVSLNDMALEARIINKNNYRLNSGIHTNRIRLMQKYKYLSLIKPDLVYMVLLYIHHSQHPKIVSHYLQLLMPFGL